MFITYPYRNNLSAYAAGLVGLVDREGEDGPAAVPVGDVGASTKQTSHAIHKHKWRNIAN